ncbi:hypothetical protein GCM10027597_61810 [Saccharopolyspora tripterygii]
MIPEAGRADNGYRRFSEVHVRALCAYRDLAHAVGPVEARRAMREIRRCSSEAGVALISSLHTGLNHEREQAVAARRALEAIDAEQRVEVEAVEADSMTITELAQALGVRSSALRFWEREGLVAPERVVTRAGTARRYGLPAIREARITAALRAGGYRVPEVREAVGAIRELRDVSGSLAALDARLLAIGRRGLALLRAGALLAELIEQTGQAESA